MIHEEQNKLFATETNKPTSDVFAQVTKSIAQNKFATLLNCHS
jgi:hypothetical protein